MKKIMYISLLLMVFVVFSSIAIANNGKEKYKRVIADTTLASDKDMFKLKGCKVVHELRDVTALNCPEGIVSSLDVRDDIKYHAIDSEANVQIGADAVWNLEGNGYTGNGITVAVLDTGIDTDHPDLVGNDIDGLYFIGGINHSISYEDDNGHGTHCSGIISSDGNHDLSSKGVAPDVKIWAGKVLGADGSGWSTDIAAAVDYVVHNNISKIISMSLGSSLYSVEENCDQITSDPSVAAINRAKLAGISVMVASGNDRGFVSSPACASGAIAVGAVDKTGLMAYFSNFGPSLDIVAPGVSIFSTYLNGGYALASGTSMAAPHVAGVAALMLQANPGLTPDEIRTALYDSATPINEDSVCYGLVKKAGPNYWIGQVDYCSSDNYGAGIVNALGAVTSIIPVDPICGDNSINLETEECDGSDLGGTMCESFSEFNYGTLTCTSSCLFDTSSCGTSVCGDGAIEGYEECDSQNLGGNTCADFGFDEGILACTSCSFDTSDCVNNGPSCGDGVCALGEDCKSCPSDCGTMPKGVCCGDGKCDTRKGETADFCPIDCS